MSDMWQVASFVICVHPDREQALLRHLRALPDVAIDVVENRGDGRLALLAESGRRGAMRSLLDSLQTLPGVISAAPVYRETVPAPDVDQESNP